MDRRYFLIPLALAVLACERQAPVAEGADDTAALPASPEPTPADPSGAPPPAESQDHATPGQGRETAVTAIPAALRGRWGLTPQDCTSTRGDAKGLLVVEAGRLIFYESRAVPSGEIETDDDSIGGQFEFTGEGQTWTRYQALELQGKNLIRTERNPNASYSYVKCT